MGRRKGMLFNFLPSLFDLREGVGKHRTLSGQIEQDRLLLSSFGCVLTYLSTEWREKESQCVDEQSAQDRLMRHHHPDVLNPICPIRGVRKTNRLSAGESDIFLMPLGGQIDRDTLLPVSTSYVPFYLPPERHSSYRHVEWCC
jgi:hypothetical protein